MIDMAMLIAQHQADISGDVIPSNIQEGSAIFASAKGPKEQMTVVIASGIYNVMDATCGGNCVNCCGVNVGIVPDPFFVPVGSTAPCEAEGTDCYGNVSYYG